MPRKLGSGAVGSFLGGRDMCGSEKVNGNKAGDYSVKISGKNGKQQDQAHTFYLRKVYVHVFNTLVTLKKDHVLVSGAVVGEGRGLWGRDSGPSCCSRVLPSSLDQWHMGPPARDLPDPRGQSHFQGWLHGAHHQHWGGSQV